ncbi:MAG: glycosyltransferase family 2 protein [Nanoarchaeota archaeon]
MTVQISVVIPAYNEQDNLEPLYKRIKEALDKFKKKYEIIFIDDGSRDRTFEVLSNLRKKDNSVKIIRFRRNFGQTASWDVGFKNASGEYIITMDADLQNDPADIPLLFDKLKEGYDVVSGWRVDRKDSFSKKIFSIFANYLRRKLTKEKIHDAGCSLKLYKKECLEDLHLYGEMHRYITTLLKLKGFKVGEVKVTHHPRIHGKTKYGFKRLFKGFFDLLFIKFWNDFSTRPLHFFGYIGFVQYVFSVLIVIEQIIKAIFFVKRLDLGPLLVLAVLFFITGTLTLLFGFLAEIMVRNYYKDKQNYAVKEKLW